MKLKYAGLLLLTLVVALAGCSSGASPDTPPEIRYGEDTCDECRMIINEPRFAAAYVTESGETRRFDDIGGMLIHHDKQSEDVAAFWVHDYDSEEWVRAGGASFVLGDDLHTPMGFGIAAFDDEERAQEIADETGGTVLGFDGLQTEFDPGDAEMEMDMENQDSTNN